MCFDMSNSNEAQDKYFKAIGVVLRDAERGTSQGLYAMEDIDKLLAEDAQGLFGVSWENLKKAGKDLWEKASPKLHTVFCDPESDEHSTLAKLIEPGSTETSAAVVAIISTQILGLVPAAVAGTVAYFLAKLILTTFFSGAYDLACEKWKETLPPEDESDSNT